MELKYDAIVNSPVYAKSKKIFEQTGKQRAKFIWLFIIGLIIFSVGLFFLPTILAGMLGIVPFVVLLFFLLKATAVGAKNWEALQEALVEFANQNSFHYLEVPYYVQRSGDNLPDIQLVLPFKAKLSSNTGYMKGIIQGLSFDYVSGSTVELVDYEGLTIQSTKRERRPLAVLRVTLPLSLPKLYIDTKRNNILGFEIKATNIEKLQRYDLEGEFPQYYQVFAESNDQINVLGLLTPEVMQKLLERKYYDVWIDGNNLVIFAAATPFEYFAGIPEIFPTAEMLLREIDKIARELRK